LPPAWGYAKKQKEKSNATSELQAAPREGSQDLEKEITKKWTNTKKKKKQE